ncbi:MAG: bacillithiol biosynthesis deacetylase BshB1 [Ignavibacteria bacterium]|nr:bacillithiol biosynthesis deacetylase BshB1 [Ignavibacteria bacterium]
MKLDLLAIGAHPDDIELTCSGALLKHIARGKSIGIADLTQGELGTRGNRVLRLEEAAAAAKVLGVSMRENLRIPDGNIAVTRENILKVITLIRACRPEILLFPYWKDRHPDHEHAHVLVREALFYAGLEKIETLVEGVPQEPFRPLRHYHFMQWEEFQPSFVIDVTKEWPRRMEAVKAFRSQFHDPESGESETILSSPDFMDFIETRGKYYGDQIGTGYGEPFFSPKAVQIEDLSAII